MNTTLNTESTPLGQKLSDEDGLFEANIVYDPSDRYSRHNWILTITYDASRITPPPIPFRDFEAAQYRALSEYCESIGG